MLSLFHNPKNANNLFLSKTRSLGALRALTSSRGALSASWLLPLRPWGAQALWLMPLLGVRLTNTTIIWVGHLSSISMYNSVQIWMTGAKSWEAGAIVWNLKYTIAKLRSASNLFCLNRGLQIRQNKYKSQLGKCWGQTGPSGINCQKFFTPRHLSVRGALNTNTIHQIQIPYKYSTNGI